jgi:hypothetical protein
MCRKSLARLRQGDIEKSVGEGNIKIRGRCGGRVHTCAVFHGFSMVNIFVVFYRKRRIITVLKKSDIGVCPEHFKPDFTAILFVL